MFKSIKTIENKDFNNIQNGTDVMEFEIKKKKSFESFNLLFNNDLLIRVQKKPKAKINKKYTDKIVSVPDLVAPRVSNILKEIYSLDKDIKERIDKDTRRSYATYQSFDDFLTLLVKRWDKIKSLEKKIKVTLLRKDKIGFCEKCNAFRQAPGLTSLDQGAVVKCPVCNLPITKNKTYYSLPAGIASYIQGRWLEDYVANKLKKLGWIVMKDLYIYGSSGVKFEIDILATKKGKTLIVECKSGGSGLKDLSSFMAIFYEIKTNLGLFITLSKAANDMKNMVSRNPSFNLIDDVKNDRDLNRRLKNI